MIQATQQSNFSAYISTEENRINKTVASSKIRHLFKFTNDLIGTTVYAYPTNETITERYTKCDFTYNATANRYTGRVNLEPSGYWKYSVFEVSWTGSVSLSSTTAPATELVVLPVAGTNGVLNGIVAIGKLYLSETAGSEEIQYTQNAGTVLSLKIQEGGAGYTSAPTITIGAGPITTATATATIAGGAVTAVTITDGGSGYTENPTVTLTGGGFTTPAVITASIYDTNYTYYGQ